jgi:hypothetical protein
MVTEISTIIDPSATTNYPSATGSIFMRISVMRSSHTRTLLACAIRIGAVRRTANPLQSDCIHMFCMCWCMYMYTMRMVLSQVCVCMYQCFCIRVPHSRPLKARTCTYVPSQYSCVCNQSVMPSPKEHLKKSHFDISPALGIHMHNLECT